MFRSLDEFFAEWNQEVRLTERVLNALTDESLAQKVIEGRRTLGQIAWHLVKSIHYMTYCGLSFEGPNEQTPIPESAATIAGEYKRMAGVFSDAVRTQWSDETLANEIDMMGETWKLRDTLRFLIMHQAHHRGQMTVLMRQAGLRPPEVYGQTYESWIEQGREPMP
jgi:uncharacterized damage-inducible protein DinB